MLDIKDVPHLRCPACRGALGYCGEASEGRLSRGALTCSGCGGRWPVERGLARLYREELVRGNDRLLRRFYDGLPWLHDPVVRYTLPIFQRGTERAFRDAYMPRLELGALCQRPDSRPVRILEIGIGCGANVPLIQRDLPPDVQFDTPGSGAPSGALQAGPRVELWGCDLSEGMLGVLQRRLRRPEFWRGRVRIVLCDAHALPFEDGFFDRVFHVGAMNSFRDPRTALAEMARVAVPGTPIVVVDEQLDPSGAHGLFHRAMFRLVTFYDRNPHCPLEHLPAGALDVREDQLSMFFYALRFRMPVRPRASSLDSVP